MTKDEDQVKGINFHDIIMDYYCMHHVYFASGCDGNPFLFNACRGHDLSEFASRTSFPSSSKYSRLTDLNQSLSALL